MMKKILISYFSKSGNTEKMANSIQQGVKLVDGIEVIVKKIQDTTIDDLVAADGIIIGSPTYFGAMAAQVKDLMDQSVKYFGKFTGKIGGAFTSSGNVAGGNETTILSILNGFLIHGMILQGMQKGNHYGPVAIGAPDDNSRNECINYGKLLGNLVLKVS